METKIKLDKDSTEVKANKYFSMGNGPAGGYTFISEADYYLIADEESVKLKSIFNDVEYTTDIDEVNSIDRTFKIGKKTYKYKVID